jgi:hypothetical protein
MKGIKYAYDYLDNNPINKQFIKEQIKNKQL